MANLRRSVLRALADNDGPMTKQEILAASGMHPLRWKAVQKNMREEGYIVNVGHAKAGARWLAIGDDISTDNHDRTESEVIKVELDREAERITQPVLVIEPPKVREIQIVADDPSPELLDLAHADINLTPIMRMIEQMDADTMVVNWSAGTYIYTVSWVNAGEFTVKVESV